MEEQEGPNNRALPTTGGGRPRGDGFSASFWRYRCSPMRGSNHVDSEQVAAAPFRPLLSGSCIDGYHLGRVRLVLLQAPSSTKLHGLRLLAAAFHRLSSTVAAGAGRSSREPLGELRSPTSWCSTGCARAAAAAQTASSSTAAWGDGLRERQAACAGRCRYLGRAWAGWGALGRALRGR